MSSKASQIHFVVAAIAEENPTQNVAALEQQANARVQPAIDMTPLFNRPSETQPGGLFFPTW